MRAANHGVRARFDRARTTRDQIIWTSAALGVTGLGLAQFGQWGVQLRQEVTTRVRDVLPSQYVDVQLARAESSGTGSPQAYWSVLQVMDRDLLTAWATNWRTPQATPSTCAAASQSPTWVSITLSRPATVQRVTITTGLAETSPQRSRQAVPQDVAIQLDDAAATCMRLHLSDTPGQQSFPVTGQGVATVRVAILSVYDPKVDSAGPTLVGISEIEIQNRG
jgi:hypothetical protein